MSQDLADIQFVRDFIAEIKNLGVKKVVVCAGARNALLVKLVSQEGDLQIWSHPEERAAAFFALGMVKQSESPIIIIVTSGTAAVECYPAVVEAHYQQLPLWIVSADRPKSYRGSGAPQVINQDHLFNRYAASWDWDAKEWNQIKQSIVIPRGPIQFNICLQDPKPLLARIAEVKPLASDYKLELSHLVSCGDVSVDQILVTNPILLIAPLTYQKHRILVSEWLKSQTSAYFYLEGASGVFDPAILNSPFRITDLDQLCVHLEKQSLIEWSLVKIGNTPLVSLWRSLESLKGLQQIDCFNEFDYSGLPQEISFNKYQIGQIKQLKLTNTIQFEQFVKEQTVLLPSNVNKSIEQFLFAKIKQRGQFHRFFIGNSLPIRHWDFLEPYISVSDFWSYRGANGIDGQLSGFLGWCSANPSPLVSHAIVGDLTALYDLQSLWIINQMQVNDPQLSVMIWIIQNRGGRIFDTILKDNLYRNAHHIEFEYWAKMFAVPYKKVQTPEQIDVIFNSKFRGFQIIEVEADR